MCKNKFPARESKIENQLINTNNSSVIDGKDRLVIDFDVVVGGAWQMGIRRPGHNAVSPRRDIRGMHGAVNVYPNPFRNTLSLEVNEAIETFAIFTVDGRQVTRNVQYAVEQGRVRIQTKDLQAGAYVIRYNDNQTEVIIKE